MASDISPDTGGGPEFAYDITEVVAVFSDDATLEDAVNRLTLAGVNRRRSVTPAIFVGSIA